MTDDRARDVWLGRERNSKLQKAHEKAIRDLELPEGSPIGMAEHLQAVMQQTVHKLSSSSPAVALGTKTFAEIHQEIGDTLKKDTGKLRYDLIPVHPLKELARVYTIGAEKYEPRGWEQGMEWSRIIAAMMRHIEVWRGGERWDPKDGQHHLASVAWCALALMEYENTHAELDDRVKNC